MTKAHSFSYFIIISVYKLENDLAFKTKYI